MPVNYRHTEASEGQYMFYTTLPSIYFGWGSNMIAGSSIDDGLLDLSVRVRRGHPLRRLAKTDVRDVLSPVVYEQLCSNESCAPDLLATPFD